MDTGSHFGCPKITLYRISYHFRSIPQFLFCEVFFTKWLPRPFWMSENHFRSHFWPFQINTQLFIYFFYKMADVGHFGCPKFTLDHISGYFRSIQIFVFFNKMAAGGHFGYPKITFDLISGHFRSIHTYTFFFFFNFWQNGCHLPFWMSEIHFGSHFWPF